MRRLALVLAFLCAVPLEAQLVPGDTLSLITTQGVIPAVATAQGVFIPSSGETLSLEECANTPGGHACFGGFPPFPCGYYGLSAHSANGPMEWHDMWIGYGCGEGESNLLKPVPFTDMFRHILPPPPAPARTEPTREEVLHIIRNLRRPPYSWRLT